ncbi:MAG: PQQ-binding-like beta-propeller repeat protein [Planctomycetota bacterium]
MHRNYRRILRFSLATSVVVFCAGPSLFAEQPSWTRFQNGGAGLGETALPTSWTATENIAWSADIQGYGQSTPIVAHDQIVVTSTSGDNKDAYHITSYAIDDGKKNWQVDINNPSPYKNTPMVSRAAPSAIATESGFVTFFEGGIVVAVAADGTKRWEKDLVAEYGKIEARHGLAASLETDGERVYVWVERMEQPYLLALDPQSGDEIWKSPGVGATSWGSPRLISVAGGKHLVCSASGKIVGFDPSTGSRLWEFDEITSNTSATPTPVGEGQFLIGASDGRGASTSGGNAASNGLIEISKAGDGKWKASYKWQAKKATSSFGSPIVAGGTAAIVNRSGVLYRLDLETGEQVSVDRTDAGGLWATPIVAGDLIYLFGYKGTTTVMSLKDGKEIAENRCWEAAKEESSFGGGNVLYAAAVSSPYLFLRRGDKLFAIKEGT